MKIRKKFEILILKNTLAIAIPAIVVFLVLIFLLIKYPVFNHVNTVKLDESEVQGSQYIEKLSELYDDKKTNVSIKVTDLYYTGFDYKVDGKIKGAYYYSMKEDKLKMYLISTKEPEEYIEAKTIKGKIIKDGISAQHILSSLAQTNGISEKNISGYCSEYLISEVDYPKAYIVLVYLFYAAPILISILIVAYTAVIWIFPTKHSQARQLENYGDKKEVLKEIDNQLSGEDIFKKKNITITSEYMIVSYMTKTYVINLSKIKYLSKNEVEKKTLFGKNKVIYRLTISNPEIMFYEVDFNTEELCDEIIEYVEASRI